MIDIIFILLMVMALFKGYSRGLIVAFFSLVAIVIGLAAALKLSWVVSNYAKVSLHVDGKWMPFLSFAIVFVGIVFIVKWLAAIVKKTAKIVLVGWLDVLGGIALYAAMYIIIYSVLLYYAGRINLLGPSQVTDSATYPYIMPWGPFVIDNLGKVIPIFSDLFTNLSNFFEGVSNKLK